MRVCEYQREVKWMETYQVLELEEGDWDAVAFVLYCGSLDGTARAVDEEQARAVYEALCRLGGKPPCWGER